MPESHKMRIYGQSRQSLKNRASRYGISQGKLAAVIGIGSFHVYRWCNEIRDPTSETVVRIVNAIAKIDPDAAAEFRQWYIGDAPLEET